jgi:hypothetical protein
MPCTAEYVSLLPLNGNGLLGEEVHAAPEGEWVDEE